MENKYNETSNLPLAYFEFQENDPDDIAVCCGDLRFIVAKNEYYGFMYLTPQPNFTDTKLKYTFESEYGVWAGIASALKQDYLPLLYATYNNGVDNVNFGSQYIWQNESSNTMKSTVEDSGCSDRIKVFVGSSKPLLEKQQQFNQIELLTDQSPDKTVEAVLTLNDYYTVESIGSLINSFGITINRVYMWPEGKTRRLSLYVEDNDIKCSIENYIQQVESNGSYNDPAFAADYIRFLNGEYKVFALTVTATAKTLADLSTETNMVSGIDVKYNADAEAYAAEQGSQVTYIELPAKPDGAQ